MENKQAHTPGPWTITKPNGKIWDIEIHGPTYSGLGHKPIASVQKGFSCSDENARLIAAAPELLAALKATLAYIEEVAAADYETDESLPMARAAILRAEGK